MFGLIYILFLGMPFWKKYFVGIYVTPTSTDIKLLLYTFMT